MLLIIHTYKCQTANNVFCEMKCDIPCIYDRGIFLHWLIGYTDV